MAIKHSSSTRNLTVVMVTEVKFISALKTKFDVNIIKPVIHIN